MEEDPQTPKAVVVDAVPSADSASTPPEPVAGQNSVDSTPDTELSEEQENKKQGLKGILSTVAILVIAPLIALSLTIFVFQSYEVDGPSMETTLQNHDRLIVYKLPKTIAKITGRAYVPKRAQVIIFSRNDSAEFGGNSTRQLIKRVIALPGERVVVKNSTITVYNAENPDGFQPDKIADYGKVITMTSGDVDITVPNDSVFVCGDNRPQSLDSRAFGPVPLKDVVGKLSLRVYPFGKGQKF